MREDEVEVSRGWESKNESSSSPFTKLLKKFEQKRKNKMPYKSDAQRKLVWAKRGEKPTRYRFKGRERLGFRGNKVVEIVQFKEKK